MWLPKAPAGSSILSRRRRPSGLAQLVVSCAAASGCVAPEPVLRLTPLSENVLWIGGTAAAIKEGKSVRVAAAFDRQQEDLVSFQFSQIAIDTNRHRTAQEVFPDRDWRGR
jgi:hypothetical protein